MKRVYILTIFILSLFFISNNAISQIVYTDIDPDTTVSEFLQGYGVDFNDDAKVDLHITLLDNVGVWVMHLIPDSDTDFTYVVYDGEEASVLVDDDYISASSDLYRLGDGWGSLLYGYWENSGEFGNWTGIQDDKYLGIKFEIDDNFHYGWIQLSTIIHDYDSMEFTVQGFAYNTVVDEGIKAGDRGEVGVDNSKLNKLSVYPNPAKDIVNLPIFINASVITISDISGRIIMQTNSQYLLNNKMDISTLNTGLYIIHVEADKKAYTVKFLKE